MSRGETERSGEKKKKVHSLWLSRKKGESESSSGSGEERQGARMCSAPVRKRSEGRKEGREEGRQEGRKGRRKRKL